MTISTTIADADEQLKRAEILAEAQCTRSSSTPLRAICGLWNLRWRLSMAEGTDITADVWDEEKLAAEGLRRSAGRGRWFGLAQPNGAPRVGAGRRRVFRSARR